MPKYAAETSVSPERSLAEIQQTLDRYGAEQFAFIKNQQAVQVAFELRSRRIRFQVSIPKVEDMPKTNGRHQLLTTARRKEMLDQAIRQRFRALLLVIKSKLEAVDSGIETVEQAFMAHMLLPNGETISEWMEPQMNDLYLQGQMPPLLTSGRV